ncbi:lipoprotein [Shewanella waksmanii]|uniref:LPS translocon maturation chaperone LptM n=1 Tax=Shewanella waksmanii TaxID=213783 RepID=UPI00373699DD
MLKKMRLFSLLLLGSLLITACGQKGALYKSPEKQDNQTEQAQSEQQAKSEVEQSNKE